MFWNHHTRLFQLYLKMDEMAFKESGVKKCRYLDEICLVYKGDFITPSFRQSHQRSALFHWVPNVNSCSVFIISTAGDSLNHSGSSSFQRPWTKSGITRSIRKIQVQHCWSLKKKSYLTSMIIVYFYPKINLIRLMRLKQLSSCRECTTLSAELTKVSASIIVNPPCQERVFSAGQRLPHVIREDQKVSRGTAETYQSQMESYSPSLWHVDVRHYLSRSQQTCYRQRS